MSNKKCMAKTVVSVKKKEEVYMNGSDIDPTIVIYALEALQSDSMSNIQSVNRYASMS